MKKYANIRCYVREEERVFFSLTRPLLLYSRDQNIFSLVFLLLRFISFLLAKASRSALPWERIVVVVVVVLFNLERKYSIFEFLYISRVCVMHSWKEKKNRIRSLKNPRIKIDREGMNDFRLQERFAKKGLKNVFYDSPSGKR